MSSENEDPCLLTKKVLISALIGMRKSTTSLRDLEVSVAKLYAIVNSQAAAIRDKDTNNQK